MTHEEFYQASNLTTNPFRSNPTLEADPRMGIWVGYNKERDLFLKYLTRTRADQVGNINFLMIYGDLGTGKTHALLWARHHILKQAAKEFDSVAYYIPTLKKSKGQISFAGAFSEDVVGNSNLSQDILLFKQFMAESLIEYKKENGLGPSTTLEAAAEQILKSSELYNFARKVLTCDTPQDVQQLLSPSTDYEAMSLFSKIVNLFVFEFQLKAGKKRFKQGAYLFIDELDLLERCTAKEAREVNDLIRHLYDSCPTCFCLTLGFTATAASIGVLFTDYVLSRVTKQIILDYLQPDEARVFVKAILDTARVDSKKKGAFPFTEEAVETITSQIVSITPRKVVYDLQQILEEARLAGLDPRKGGITSAMLEEKGILAEVQGRNG